MKTNKTNLYGLTAFFLVLLVGCRTPQQLIDKAIDKDSTIVNKYNDTITAVRWKVDSIPYEVAGQIHYRDTTIAEYYDTIINCQTIEIERKRTRFEIRKNYQLQKHAQQLQYKLDAKQKEIEKLTARFTARNERKETKHKQRTERTQKRQQRKEKRPNWLFWFGLSLGSGITICLSYFATFIKNRILP